MEFVEGRAAVDDVEPFLERLRRVGEEHDCTVQAFDARYVAGCRHLERARELADRAFDRGENVARDRAVEILLYAAGRRQIDRALEMGVTAGEPVVVLVAAREDVPAGERAGREAAVARAVEGLDGFVPEPTLGTATDPERVRTFFEVSAAEEAATDADLQTLVCERVALLDVEK